MSLRHPVRKITVELTFEKFLKRQLYTDFQYSTANEQDYVHTATRCNTPEVTTCTADLNVHCNTLLHTATYCNTLQHTADHRYSPSLHVPQTYMYRLDITHVVCGTFRCKCTADHMYSRLLHVPQTTCKCTTDHMYRPHIYM